MPIQYPALYVEADRASLGAQASHFRLLRLQLGLFLVVSLISTLLPIIPGKHRTAVAVALPVTLAAALLVMWISRYRRDERIWFDSRAIAESTKTTTWRYLMQASPFDSGDIDEVTTLLISRLTEIRRAFPGVEQHITGERSVAAPLPDSLRSTRALPLRDRQQTYLRERIIDERDWYRSRCVWNRTMASRWFWSVVGLQSCALFWAIGQVQYGPSLFNVIAILMVLSATFVAWSQSRRYEELVQPYGLAAQELDSLQALLTTVSTETQFRQLVEQAEDAISREHTMWCVRRHVHGRG